LGKLNPTSVESSQSRFCEAGAKLGGFPVKAMSLVTLILIVGVSATPKKDYR
jgi:hypothetical protein